MNENEEGAGDEEGANDHEEPNPDVSFETGQILESMLLQNNCGLPCACRLEWYENTESKIPLAAIDVFWTRLNLLPEEIEKNDSNIDKEMDKVKQQLNSQPPQVKESLLSKIRALINPSMTDHQPPDVQQDTRGSPTAKAQQQRKEETQKPAVQHSRSKKSKAKMAIPDKDFPLLEGDSWAVSSAVDGGVSLHLTLCSTSGRPAEFGYGRSERGAAASGGIFLSFWATIGYVDASVHGRLWYIPVAGDDP
ncbi:hypothetical protein L1987_11346 [Smallanthus sonchifolius]|uniref:Uncharacterized protein n=1 Tax=Smallanthus sonchifolius TaxID=185202 RepID=A0ACB9JBL7_9ASTR|nr:hypothetical protein L1987_11346 [Smallanthus sonchifolius]